MLGFYSKVTTQRIEMTFWFGVEVIDLYSHRNIKSVTEDLSNRKKTEVTKERTTINNERKTLKEAKDK